MMPFRIRAIVLSCLVLAIPPAVRGAAPVALPEDLALKATASASSEHNSHYLAKFAIDGKVPAAGSVSDDLDAAWCVLKERSGDKADFTLQWKEPIRAAEIVYFGRTAWFLSECWKDYEVYADESSAPAAKGTLEMIDGPQRISLPPTTLRKLTIKFLNSYGGPNPGASEIMVFAASPGKKELALIAAKAKKVAPGDDSRYAACGGIPPIDEVDRGKLRGLIVELMRLHGPKYPAGPQHLARLEQLPDGDERLVDLQREVLLMDVDKLVVIKRHEIQGSHVYTYHYEGFSPGGELCVVALRRPREEATKVRSTGFSREPGATPPKGGTTNGTFPTASGSLDPEEKPRVLVASPTGQILDCDVSYDGRRILFSWRKKADEGYHVWRINADGSDLVPLTSGPWHDYNPCWLPDGGIAFLSTRNPQFAYCWHAPVGILHRMDADGSQVQRLSANYLNDFTPAVLDDGRIIYTRWEYVDRPAIPIQSLWTINPDGTALAGYFGNRKISPATFMEARPIPGTTKIVCTMTGHNGPTRGALGVIDRSKGVNAQAAIENITPDVPVPLLNQGDGNTQGSKQYSGAYPLDGRRLLCSIRGPLLVRTLDGGCQSLALPGPNDGMQWLCARPLRPRSRPPVIASTLPEHADGSATLVLQDVYNGLEPYVKRGEVKRLRVVRDMAKSVRIDPSLRSFGFQFPVISCGATYAAKDVIGEAPIEDDGSACLRVPARTPMYFIALDAQGRGVQRMRSFTHLMPGEIQGCIGCHEHRLQASRPRVTLAAFRPARDLEPPEWGAGGFDYSRVVQPVLDKYCTRCHGPLDPQGIDLTGGKTDFFSVSYEVLARDNQGRQGSPYVNWIPTYNGQEWNILEVKPKFWGSPASKLAGLILAGHPDAAGKPQIDLDDASRRRLFAWIDLNVPYYGTSETAYPEREGCRRILPGDLEKVLAEVAARRCAECHKDGKFPRRVWTRITEPAMNNFLLAPLARSAGGSQKCGKAVFAATDDPDYRAILAAFEPVTAMLKSRPRMDMPGAKASCTVSRSCQ
jgi:hypothetical protein